MSTSLQCVLCQALGVWCMCSDMVAKSVYSVVHDATQSGVTMEGHGPSTELEVIIQDPTDADFAAADMYGTEGRAVIVLHIPSANEHHDPGAEFADVMETPKLPTAKQSVQASCRRACCRWRDGDTPRICGAVISCEDVPMHFKLHGIKNLEELHLVVCKWEGCYVECLRKNFARHIRECHLYHSRGKGHSS